MLMSKQKLEIDKNISKYLMVSAGCTEPIAIAYAAAVARSTLSGTPVNIGIYLSPNMAKNAMDAGIPGSKYVGTAFAASLGALYGDYSKGFELLKDIPEDKQKEAYEFSKTHVTCNPADSKKALYIGVEMTDTNANHVKVVTEDDHTNIVLIELNGNVKYKQNVEGDSADDSSAQEVVHWGPKEIYEYVDGYCTSFPLFKDAIKLNSALSEHGKVNNYGLNVGKVIPFGEDTIVSRITTFTTSAVDSRMGGAPLSAMACTGSGNQGITVSLPVVQYAKEIGASEEQTIKAVAVAMISAMYVKKDLAVLSHLCGAVIAATGASAGLVYLMGGDYKQAEYAMQNVLGTVTGMFCDGAKSTCALKVNSCIYTAICAANMAMSMDHCITARVGIVGNTLDETVANIAKIERDSADVMNKTVLDIIMK